MYSCHKTNILIRKQTEETPHPTGLNMTILKDVVYIVFNYFAIKPVFSTHNNIVKSSAFLSSKKKTIS